MMAIGAFFQPSGLTAETYRESLKQLEAAGAGSPKGRLHHFAFGPHDALMIFDIWESQEALDALGPTLVPVLQAIGIGQEPPDIMPIHNVIRG